MVTDWFCLSTARSVPRNSGSTGGMRGKEAEGALVAVLPGRLVDAPSLRLRAVWGLSPVDGDGMAGWALIEPARSPASSANVSFFMGWVGC